MSISWGNSDVRVYAADAWVSLAQRFAAEHPEIIDRIEVLLADPAPAVRLKAAENLQVICVTAPECMWAIGERIATEETSTEILTSYLSYSMRRFCHSDPERCETVLTIVKGRLDVLIAGDHQGRYHLLGALGGWTAQLFAVQGREIARTWLKEWSAYPHRYGDLLDSFASSLRVVFFGRYAGNAEVEACAMCDRAQDGLALILTSATTISAEAYRVFASDVAEADKQAATERYRAAEKVILHAMNQLYFGSGAHGGGPGLPDAVAMTRFLVDYANVLALLASTREPATLHKLIELYEFLIPGDPVMVFEVLHSILLGRGKEEGYHYESLGNTAVVEIVKRYIADYRTIFDDEGRRARLVAILQLFSYVGWADALKLLYDLPDLLR